MRILPFLLLLINADVVAQNNGIRVHNKITKQRPWPKPSDFDYIATDIATGKELYKCVDCSLLEPLTGDLYLTGKGYRDKKDPYYLRAEKVGLVNVRTGQEVYPTKAFHIEKASECMIIVIPEQKELRIFLDAKGNRITAFTHYLGNSSQKIGIVPIRIDKLYGLSDTCGNIISEVKYDEVFGYDNGVYISRLNGKYGLIGANGKEIISPRYNYIDYFQNGLARFSYDAIHTGAFEWKGTWGIIDKSGQELVAPKYDDLTMKEGRITVKINNEWKPFSITDQAAASAAATINPTPFQKDCYQPFCPGDPFGYKYPNGEIAIKPQWDEAYTFSANGLAIVGKKGKDSYTNMGGGTSKYIEYGLIDLSGKTVLPLKYKTLYPIKPGLYSFSEGGDKSRLWKAGLMDAAGNVKVKPEFNEIREPAEGLMAARKGEDWGYIDFDGQTVIPFRNARFVTNFDKGHAVIAYTYTSYALIDRNGKEVFPGKRYTDISNIDSSGNLRVSHRTDQWGRPDSTELITLEGKVLKTYAKNGPPPPRPANSTLCDLCRGSGMAYKARDVNSGFTLREGMFNAVEKTTTYSYSYRVYEKAGACLRCGGDGYY